MQSKFSVILRIGFDIITTMIVQNTIFRNNLFRIDSFDSWTCPPWEGRKNSTAQQGTVLSKFRVILRIGFDIITTMIVQNTIFITALFKIDNFDSWTCSLGEAQKIQPLNREQC